MKKVHVVLLILMAAALLPFFTMATEMTCITDSVINDPTAVIDEAPQAATVTDTDIPMDAVDTDTVSEQATVEYFMEDKSILGDPNMYRKYRGVDFHFLKNTTNPAVKPYTFMQDQTWVGIPVFVAGMIAKSEKAAFRQDYNNTNTKIRLIKYNFHSEIDNYTQFSGIALTAGLKMAGVEGRSSWPRLLASSLASYAVMATFVNSIKYTASEMRPDGSTRNSWPSGHTATAFAGATILHKEYGLTRSPWYSIAGYTVATATGVMRVLNNRHWISDVLSGAGIGILSTELAYGICDLLFKQKGLLMNDLSYYSDLSKNPSFFSISMGIGLGNKNLTLPPFEIDYGSIKDIFEIDEDDDFGKSDPLSLQFRSATAVGAEGAWFFNPYVGIGGRLRVKSTPIKGWNIFAQGEAMGIKEILDDPLLQNSVYYIDLEIESDHITEFAADAGIYFSLPLSSRFAIGSKLLVGRSIMDDIEVKAEFEGEELEFNLECLGNDDAPMFSKTGMPVKGDWEFANVHASNSMKYGTGLSLTYSYKNSFSWRLFCDYDYCKKTYTASYSPFKFFETVTPDMTDLLRIFNFDIAQTMVASATKHLHQWVLGGALCVSF